MRAALLLLVLVCRLSPAGWAAPASSGASPESKKETLLAVMDIINNTGEFPAFVDGMPDMLITELMVSGDVKLVERTKVQTAMKALKLETSGLTQERNLELGKWLGVDGILFGAFNRVGDSYRLDVRAIDVQTGKIEVAASAVCGKQNLLDMIPEIGRQLRVKLSPVETGKDGAHPSSSASLAAQSAVDSCSLEIQYKMMVSLFAEASIPYQRVRVYLDDRLLGISGVIDDLNRYFTVFKGNVSAGSHTLVLVHGTVDKQGRWLRELGNQPAPYSFIVRKHDQPFLQYGMRAHEGWFAFQDFNLKYNNHTIGE
jgi:TolB-like protein